MHLRTHPIYNDIFFITEYELEFEMWPGDICFRQNLTSTDWLDLRNASRTAP